MKANELRIGNIINDTSGEDLPVKAIRTRKRGVDEVKVKGYIDWVYVGYCDGVAITEEWLVKLGFEKCIGSESDYEIVIQKNEGGGISEYWLWVDLHDEDNHNNDMYPCASIVSEGNWLNTNIKYVHQLQNLYFALTGKELELKQL